MNEATYTLNVPFSYAHKGESVEAQFITLKAPTMKQHSQASSLKQSIMKLLKSVTDDADESEKSESKDDSDDSELSGENLVMLMFSSDVVDINVIFEQAKAVFKAGCALVDGEQPLNGNLIEKFDPEDFQNLVGEYILNFTIA